MMIFSWNIDISGSVNSLCAMFYGILNKAKFKWYPSQGNFWLCVEIENAANMLQWLCLGLLGEIQFHKESMYVHC